MIGRMLSTIADAQKLSIEQIQKGVQSGSIPSYVGIPLIEQKTKEAQQLQAAQALMRQIQGGPPSTVSEQVMQAADQVTRPAAPPTPAMPATDQMQPAPSQGITSAPSNLPQSYAGGGIVAFDEGGSTTDRAAGFGWFDNGNPTLNPLENWRKDWARRRQNDSDFMDVVRAQDKGAMDSLKYWWDKARGVEEDNPNLNRAITPEEHAKRREANPPPLKVDRGVTDPNAVKGGGEGGIPQLVVPPSAAPAAAPAESQGGFEFNKYMENMRADRQALRDLITGQKGDREKSERDNLSNALMKAGFATMAGRSPYAMTNIGEGAMAGLESYTKGIDQLAAKDERIVQQLVNLGLKGADLENAAAQLGVTAEHYKSMVPYYNAQAEASQASARLHNIQADMYPQLQNAKLQLMAKRAAGAGGGAGGKGNLPASVAQKELDRMEGFMANPRSAPFYHKLPPKIRTALENTEPGSSSYEGARSIFGNYLKDYTQNRMGTIQSFNIRRTQLDEPSLSDYEF